MFQPHPILPNPTVAHLSIPHPARPRLASPDQTRGDHHTIEIVEAKAEHVRQLLPMLRRDDQLEIEAAGVTCKRALWQAWRRSHLRTTAFVDGQIAAMWGCGGGLIDPVGRPWLLTADVCEKVPLAFVKIGRVETGRMLAIHETLQGYVHAKYWRAVRTLSLWGFRLCRIVKLGNGEFLEYRMTRDFSEWNAA